MKNNPEELLRKLLEHFYISSDGSIEWSYIEGTKIHEVTNKEFELKLIPYMEI